LQVVYLACLPKRYGLLVLVLALVVVGVVVVVVLLLLLLLHILILLPQLCHSHCQAASCWFHVTQ
jgi:hypothetical protein